MSKNTLGAVNCVIVRFVAGSLVPVFLFCVTSHYQITVLSTQNCFSRFDRSNGRCNKTELFYYYYYLFIIIIIIIIIITIIIIIVIIIIIIIIEMISLLSASVLYVL